MVNSSLCYIFKNDKVLLIHKNKKENDFNEGKWIGVGGKFEPDETPDECVVREVFEETGLTLTKFHLHGVVKFISDVWEDQDMYLYSATEFTGELTKDCSEGDLCWVDRDMVLKLPTWEGDHFFIDPLLNGQEKIDMLVRYEGKGKEERLAEVKDFTEPVLVEKAKGFLFPHGFSTKKGGVSDGTYSSLNLGMNRGDIKERVIENWRRFLIASDIPNKEFVCGNQVHENNVHIATYEDLRPAYGPGELIRADGYVTNLPLVPLAIFTADCVPLLLEDSKNKVIGAIHCGWRSTVSDIEGEAIKKMLSLGAEVSNIHAAIGPSIDMCCFEVGKEVIDAVNSLLSEDSASLYTKKESGKYMLNLRGVVERRLLQLGLHNNNIEWVGECTHCHPEKYWSHRYTNGVRGSLASIICIK